MMEIVIEPGGNVRCIYDDSIPLHPIGQLLIRRASHVEPDYTGHWYADLLPVRGPQLGPFGTRTEALNAEYRWLQENWLLPAASS